MSSRFSKAFYYTMENEGISSDDPEDPGGATKYGISLSFLKLCHRNGSIWADINQDGKIDKQDIADINIENAKDIYEKQFWSQVQNIPDDSIAIKVFDAGVNIGTHRAIKMLQKVLGVTSDGIVGKDTINAVKASNRHSVMRDFIDKLCTYYRKLAYAWHNDKFLDGWINRARRIPAGSFWLDYSGSRKLA